MEETRWPEVMFRVVGAIFNSFYALVHKFVPNTLRGHDLKTLRRGCVPPTPCHACMPPHILLGVSFNSDDGVSGTDQFCADIIFHQDSNLIFVWHVQAGHVCDTTAVPLP